MMYDEELVRKLRECVGELEAELQRQKLRNEALQQKLRELGGDFLRIGDYWFPVGTISRIQRLGEKRCRVGDDVIEGISGEEVAAALGIVSIHLQPKIDVSDFGESIDELGNNKPLPEGPSEGGGSRSRKLL